MKTLLTLTFCILICKDTLCVEKRNMAGGFRKVDIEECNLSLGKIRSELHQALEGHEITGCEKQLVNGINHRIELSNGQSEVAKCSIVVWHDFKKTKFEILENRAGDQDCSAKLSEVFGDEEI